MIAQVIQDPVIPNGLEIIILPWLDLTGSL